MLIALGETYERLEKYEETYKCYQQARNVGKNDPLAIIKMAKLVFHFIWTSKTKKDELIFYFGFYILDY